MSERVLPLPGALVISLDFELHWGVRDRHPAEGNYRSHLLGARRAVPQLLDLFEEFQVAATWATVGFLFAESREELERFSPQERPTYADPALSPYAEEHGRDEADDPFHFASSLIGAIQGTPRQEIATHTFSHYYCLEEGQTAASFRADLEAACALALRRGIRFESIVFPRNQHNPAYDEVLLANGIVAYRGNPPGWMYREGDARASSSRWRRAARLSDAYLNLSGYNTVSWPEVSQPNGLANVRASFFLRPYSPGLRHLDPLRLDRLCRGLRHAAGAQRIFHLWWHPHNFGSHTEENLRFLRAFLTEFGKCREKYGMQSMSMAEVAGRVRQEEPGLKPRSHRCQELKTQI